MEECVTVLLKHGSTEGMSAIGSSCVFPFIYEGKTWNQCAPEDVSGLPWCSTQVKVFQSEVHFCKPLPQVDSTGHHVLGNWGYCSNKCPPQDLSLVPSPPPSSAPSPPPNPAPGQIPDTPQNHFPPNQISLEPIVIALEPSPAPSQIPDPSQKPPQNNPEGKCVTVAPMQGSSTDIGSPCVFPFIHYDKIWNECVFELIGKGSNLHWCSTQV